MKIYTKTGDTGTTSLFDGSRVQKSTLVINSLGDIDELSSHVGMLAVLHQSGSEITDTFRTLRTIQSCLQNVGSVVATPKAGIKASLLTSVHISNTHHLETSIDRMEEDLPALTTFILPGVSKADAQAQICRSVCRRAERSITLVNTQERGVPIPEEVIVFMNRLSDYFFVLSRWLCFKEDLSDCVYNDYKPIMK
jgi:cob(I)alamin adenosyltransferase